MPRLLYQQRGSTEAFEFGPEHPVIVIGRNIQCDVRINSPSMSRRHAELRFNPADGTTRVSDLNSSNGTFVNAERITSSSLHHSDEIVCGEFRFIFEADRPSRSTTGVMSPSSETSQVLNVTFAKGRTAAAGADSADLAMHNGLLSEDDEAASATTQADGPRSGDTPPAVEVSFSAASGEFFAARPTSNAISDAEYERHAARSSDKTIASGPVQDEPGLPPEVDVAALRRENEHQAKAIAGMRNAFADLEAEIRRLVDANERLEAELRKHRGQA